MAQIAATLTALEGLNPESVMMYMKPFLPFGHRKANMENITKGYGENMRSIVIEYDEVIQHNRAMD